MAAPPIPWMPRQTIRTSGEVASPQAIEAVVKTTRPPRKTFRRP